MLKTSLPPFLLFEISPFQEILRLLFSNGVILLPPPQKKINHEIEKKAPAQPELSSRSDFSACFVVVVKISFDPVTSTILEQDLREL